MASLDRITEDLRRSVFTVILAIFVCSSFIITILHYLDASHALLPDLVVPPIGFIVSSILLYRLLKEPSRITTIIGSVVIVSFTALAIPVYYYFIRVVFFTSESLFDLLPPLSSGPFLLTTILIVFLGPRSSLRRTVWIWLSIALPIAVYFILHPNEVLTPRGKDWFVTLGPLMAVNTCLVFYHTRMNIAVNQMEVERMRFKVASETDVMTGAFNRRAGELMLSEITAIPTTRGGIILADIDRFKSINDTYGHAVGDKVIQSFAKGIMDSLRENDTLVRWGGEEFMVIVRESSEKDLHHLAERLRHHINTIQIEPLGNFTASFGVALAKYSEPAEQLFERADSALYRAKENGRNRVEMA